MKARFALLVLIAAIGISLFPRTAVAGTSEASRKALTRLLLGKEVKPLLQLPASKEGIDIYYSRKGDCIDERGLDRSMGGVESAKRRREGKPGDPEWTPDSL